MSSRQTQNRLRLCLEIEHHGVHAPISCDRCFLSGKPCIAMEGRKKCSECVRQNKPCVNLSWESLDRTREEYKKKVDEAEDELARAMAKLIRCKKILRQAEERAKHKAIALEEEMSLLGELEGEEDCPAASVGIGVSPAVWNSLGFINDMVGVDGDNNPVPGGLGMAS